MLYNSCTGIYTFENNTYPRRIRRRSNLGHIFRGKSASYGPGNTVFLNLLLWRNKLRISVQSKKTTSEEQAHMLAVHASGNSNTDCRIRNSMSRSVSLNCDCKFRNPNVSHYKKMSPASCGVNHPIPSRFSTNCFYNDSSYLLLCPGRFSYDSLFVATTHAKNSVLTQLLLTW
jgi:hypothetical protein